MEEIHEGICGDYSRSLVGKIIKAGYFWPIIQKDTKEFVKRCEKCQRYGIVQRMPGEMMTAIKSLWPFAR